ncbi:MAG: aspartate kinase [Saprospiraceae bacterium]
MKQPTKVFKFGGASLKDAAAVKNVASILEKFKGQPLMIVVSAMGKTTNALERVNAAHFERNGKAFEYLNAVKQQHYAIMQELFEEGDEAFTSVSDTFVEIEWAIEDDPHEDFDYNYDQIVSVGELVSSKIVGAYLTKMGLPTAWLDARDVIRTDNLYREAWVDWEITTENADRIAKPMVNDQQFVITQGFIGSTSENFTTTLGREGSDYTAAIFSYCLDAKSMSIWKDVAGVLTADPRLFEHVIKLDRLSYKEAIEMTYYGAKVIHPKTIKPLQNKNIPLYVKSFIDPEGSGTFISDEVDERYPPMVAVEQNQALLHISTRDFSFVAEHHLRYLFQQIADHRLQVNMMQNTAISFSICVNDVDKRVEQFSNSIKKEFKTVVQDGLELITVRHFNPQIIESLKASKMLLLEQRLRKTVQMVVKNVPLMARKV